jgi:EAL domain-containing protein (putative c-di-GMP-specific phosphodiesterase class I)
MPRTEIQRSITDRLMAALQQDEFVLYAQAITPVGTASAETPFQEVFVRFKEEDAKLLPPGSFFPILEEYSLLPFLDRWVVNRVARWIRNALQVKPDWQIPRSNVNLSAETLVDAEFGAYVRKYFADAHLFNGALGLEITWHGALEHQESVRGLMAELRPHGCAFTLTDFDGQETSFELLKTFAPHFVKISSVSIDPGKVGEIIRRCHVLECRTIVEHVENEKILEHLKRAKVDFAQGFAISPVEALPV